MFSLFDKFAESSGTFYLVTNMQTRAVTLKTKHEELKSCEVCTGHSKTCSNPSSTLPDYSARVQPTRRV